MSLRLRSLKMTRMIRLFGNLLLLASILFAGAWVWYYLIEYQEYNEFTIATPLLKLFVALCCVTSSLAHERS